MKRKIDLMVKLPHTHTEREREKERKKEIYIYGGYNEDEKKKESNKRSARIDKNTLTIKSCIESLCSESSSFSSSSRPFSFVNFWSDALVESN